MYMKSSNDLDDKKAEGRKHSQVDMSGKSLKWDKLGFPEVTTTFYNIR